MNAQGETLPWIFIATVAAVCFGIRRYFVEERARSKERVLRERELKTRLQAEQEALRARSLRDSLKVARERARIAFPDLVTAEEALGIDSTAVSAATTRSKSDQDTIREAIDAIEHEVSLASEK